MDHINLRIDSDQSDESKSIFHFEICNYKAKAKASVSSSYVLDVGKRVWTKVYDNVQTFR